MFLNSVGNPTPNHESKYIVPCPGHPRAHFPLLFLRHDYIPPRPIQPCGAQRKEETKSGRSSWWLKADFSYCIEGRNLHIREREIPILKVVALYSWPHDFHIPLPSAEHKELLRGGIQLKENSRGIFLSATTFDPETGKFLARFCPARPHFIVSH